MSASDVTIYASGPLSLSVCAPRDWTETAVAAEVNRIHPAGGTLSWQISDAKTFADGTPHPADCNSGLPRRHWLLHC